MRLLADDGDAGVQLGCVLFLVERDLRINVQGFDGLLGQCVGLGEGLRVQAVRVFQEGRSVGLGLLLLHLLFSLNHFHVRSRCLKWSRSCRWKGKGTSVFIGASETSEADGTQSKSPANHGLLCLAQGWPALELCRRDQPSRRSSLSSWASVRQPLSRPSSGRISGWLCACGWLAPVNPVPLFLGLGCSNVGLSGELASDQPRTSFLYFKRFGTMSPTRFL